MCGIAGVIGSRITSEISQKFTNLFNLLEHRGPNGHLITQNSFPGSQTTNFIFGHHRLSIVDLDARANQPLYSKSGSSLIINGEIYNASKIRNELKNQYDFKTSSDSEVALAVLEIYGLPGVSRLDGMFAFAFYPAGETSVWLGRDRLGIKPLYFARNLDEVWFSSEAKPLAKVLQKDIDEIGISEWVQYQFQVSSRTFFSDIYSVPPGHLLTIKDGIIKSRQYWNIEDHLSSNNGRSVVLKEAVGDLRDLLKAAVERHLMSDVQIATITSGGLDSSSVSVIAADLGVKEAFVGRYLESGYDESNYAQLVTDFKNLNLNIIDIDEARFFDTLSKVASALDYPTAGPGSIGQYLVAQEVAKTFRVVLAGTGGDELLLGYTRDQFPLWAASEKLHNSFNTLVSAPPNSAGYELLFERFISGGGWESPISGFMATLERNSKNSSLLSIPKHRQIAIASELRAFISPSGGESLTEIHDSLLRYEVSKFLPSLLQVEDRTTMAHGLESRVPLLDLELMEFLLSLPASIRLTGNSPKDLLRMVMSHDLPHEVINRRDKMGFPVPFMVWSKAGLPKKALSLLDNLKARQIPGLQINPRYQQTGHSPLDARELWGGLILESWLLSLD